MGRGAGGPIIAAVVEIVDVRNKRRQVVVGTAVDRICVEADFRVGLAARIKGDTQVLKELRHAIACGGAVGEGLEVETYALTIGITCHRAHHIANQCCAVGGALHHGVRYGGAETIVQHDHDHLHAGVFRSAASLQRRIAIGEGAKIREVA